MRIHTYLCKGMIEAAALKAGVGFERLTLHGSKSRTHAFDVLLSGNGVTGGAWGNSGTNGAAAYKSATWDEWGIFLGYVFDADPTATAATYHDADDFHWQTGHRFHGLAPADQHIRHRWTYTNGPGHHCKCGAARRFDHVADYSAREGGNVFELAGSAR